MIPVADPIIPQKAKKYLLECLESGWVSSKGPFVEKFEKAFAKLVGTKYAVATNSGTAALHLALATLKIGPGDEVVVPALTMIAAVLPVVYVGAKPVLVEAELNTGNIDINKVTNKITKRTKAIIPVHLNGHPVDMFPLLAIAHKHNLWIIEDAAEAHGALYRLKDKWKMVGSIGDMGCFSFYGNKIITSGEGGMITTNNKSLAERAKSLRNLARTPNIHFLHQEIAFAYRMSNMEAALGLSQVEDFKKFIAKKLKIVKLYNKLLADVPNIRLPIQKDYAKSSFWQYGILLSKDSPISRDKLAKYLEKYGIETRNFVIPLHRQPAFLKIGLFKNEHYPIAEDLSKRALCLPSGLAITDREIRFVCNLIKTMLSSPGK